ncbi:MAG: class II D-tagatose-bisphosphate aldolase, non-catalytic subunit [Rhizobiaceae bacterium]
MRANLRDIVERNRSGAAVALPSVCSSHPDVIAAAALLARRHEQPLLVEATSNQVNQFGGYTGMKADDFIGFVANICARAGLPRERVIFGGDHLGPQAWRDQDAETAMAHAADLVRSFVEAGFTKIHLDCSEGCRGEDAQVSDAVSAERTARLAAVCEQYAPARDDISYIVGTEVPPPGGARASDGAHGIVPTSPESARTTLDAQQRAIESVASSEAWGRVVGLVVQPGLEFSGDHIDHFNPGSPDRLSPILADYPGLCFEAHSTDYQQPQVFPELARRHFAILKVGPALTFAYRQAVYALDHVRNWYEAPKGRAPLADTMEALMLAAPANWERHYHGTAEDVRRLRHFGYADRIRYYWSRPEAEAAVRDLIASLEERRLLVPMLEQYFPQDVIARAEGLAEYMPSWPRALILATVQEALLPYFKVGPGGADSR